MSANHNFKDLSKSDKCPPIVIRDNVWIGANVVILPAVTIGRYSVVAAGSVVTKTIPDYSIVAGNPAKIIAKRCPVCLDKIKIIEDCCVNCRPK